MNENGSTSILLTGPTGFVGSALVDRFVSENRYKLVLALRRKTPQLFSAGRNVVVGDLRPEADWMPALAGVDVVIHTAARVHVMNETSSDPLIEFRKVNFEGTMALARQAVKASVKRFIFISSIKVNGEETVSGVPFTADDLPDPVDPYGISKAETEEALLKLAASAGMDVVIIRPVLVYGPRVKANFLTLIKWLHMGVPLPLGLIRNKRSLVAIDNLVDLIMACINHPAAANQIFLVSDDDDMSTTDLLQRTAQALGLPARLLPVPVGFIRIAATIIGKQDMSQRLLGSLQVDITKTRNILGWEPPLSVDDALRKTVNDFLHNNKRCSR